MTQISPRKGEISSKTIARVIETAVLLFLPVLIHLLFPINHLISAPYSWAGMVVMAGGFGLMGWGLRTFREHGVRFTLTEKRSSVVQDGPFRFSRNPMYLGMATWLLGLAILLGSLGAFLFPVFFFLLTHCYSIPIEEKQMEAIFGEEYRRYKRRVRRWI
jgi:protein-S-isoprenylcysteine O-methyltransferase Ste14